VLIYRLALWFGPRLSPDAVMEEPIIVVGMLRAASGVGAAARACHDALLEGGLEVYGIDLTEITHGDKTYTDFAFKSGRITGKGTILLHASGLHVPIAMSVLGQRVVHRKRIIAHWFWELPKVPKNWNLAARFVHEIWVNSHFVADAVRTVSNKPVRVVPYPLKPLQERRNESAKKSDRFFTVLLVFNVASNFTRKNPCAAITAFRRAFGDDPDARLIVKYANADVWPASLRYMEAAAAGARNVTLIGDTLGDEGMSSLYDQADVIMSLHRSEGFGLVIAEAMQRGIPVIATNWSGNTDFFDSGVGVPVGFDLVAVEDPQGFYREKEVVWAEPKIDDAACALRILRSNNRLRAELGKAASKRVFEMYNPGRYVGAIAELLHK